MADLRVRGNRRRLVCISVLAACLFCLSPASADETDEVAIVRTVTKPKPGSTGSEGTPPKAASGREVAASNRPNPCPLPSVSTEQHGLVDRGSFGKGYYEARRCTAGGWETVFVYVQDCPDGPGTPFIPPSPPSLEEVYISIHRGIPAPELHFAPPVENGAGIGAVVGKRFYVNISTDSFDEKDGTYEWGGGYWYANILIVPDYFTFSDGTSESGRCDNTATGRIAAGRAVLDGAGCFIVVNNRPANGKLPVTVTSHWHAIITTNIPGVASPQLLESATTYPVPVKEVQAVIVG